MRSFFQNAFLLFALVSIVSCSDEESNTISNNAIDNRPGIPITANEVRIGNQTWATKNLNVDHYKNGDPIPQVTDATQWRNITTGAWCYYNNDPANGAIYGKLYNWYAVNDARGLAPEGYHVPTHLEWGILAYFLGGETTAGGSMKETGTAHWLSPNTNATNSSGFTGLAGGWRNNNGAFVNVGNNGLWWSASQNGIAGSWIRILYYNNTNANSQIEGAWLGFSVRCMKN